MSFGEACTVLSKVHLIERSLLSAICKEKESDTADSSDTSLHAFDTKIAIEKSKDEIR
jgi:hypothetical protein